MLVSLYFEPLHHNGYLLLQLLSDVGWQRQLCQSHWEGGEGRASLAPRHASTDTPDIDESRWTLNRYCLQDTAELEHQGGVVLAPVEVACPLVRLLQAIGRCRSFPAFAGDSYGWFRGRLVLLLGFLASERGGSL